MFSLAPQSKVLNSVKLYETDRVQQQVARINIFCIVKIFLCGARPNFGVANCVTLKKLRHPEDFGVSKLCNC